MCPYPRNVRYTAQSRRDDKTTEMMMTLHIEVRLSAGVEYLQGIPLQRNILCARFNGCSEDGWASGGQFSCSPLSCSSCRAIRLWRNFLDNPTSSGPGVVGAAVGVGVVGAGVLGAGVVGAGVLGAGVDGAGVLTAPSKGMKARDEHASTSGSMKNAPSSGTKRPVQSLQVQCTRTYNTAWFLDI